MYAIIMAGGAGTRFWPMSRHERPKQLLSLFGPQTLLAQTVDRIAPLTSPERTLIITGAHLVDAVRQILPQIPPENVIAEPVGRNTAPCVGLAAQIVRHRAGADADPLIGVFPADHHVERPEAFRRAIADALDAAAHPGAIVTLGIKPDRPETGYGYIRHAPSPNAPAHPVLRFVEKPDRPTAERYLADGDHLWNAGLFFFRASTMIAEIQRQLPDLDRKLTQIADAFGDDDGGADALARLFPTIDPVSIDYGVMEGAPDVKVVPVEAGWSDVGHWAALPDLLGTDSKGTVLRGEVVAVDLHDTAAFNEDPNHLLALVGLRDLIVVHTPDATLVLHRDRAQDVRAVVDALKASGRDDLL